MTGYPNKRDCEHGLLRRSCEICRLEGELVSLAKAIRTIDDGDIPPGAIRWKEERWLELQQRADSILFRADVAAKSGTDHPIEVERGFKAQSGKHMKDWDTENTDEVLP